MKKFTIKSNRQKDEFDDFISFQAHDEKGEIIFGAKASCSRKLKSISGKDVNEGWKITWGSTGSRPLEEKEVEFAVIEKAINFAREENKKLNK